MSRFLSNNKSPWQWILIVGGLFALVLKSLWMGLALGAFGVLWLRKKLGEVKSDGRLTHINHRFLIKALQPWKFPKRLNRLMPYPARQRHTLAVGRSGSGKSSFLKARIAADLAHSGGMLVIDAHGDMVRELARLRHWEKESERMVYLTPSTMSNGVFPSFNPFEVYGKMDPQSLSLRVSELATAFEALFRSELTHHMKLMLKRVTALLLSSPGHSILDMLRIIEPGGEELALKLCVKQKDEDLRRYFQEVFIDRKTVVTRHAVGARLADVLENHAVKQILGQRHSSFDLERLLNSGKTVLFDLSQATFGVEGAKIIGALLLAEVGAMALRRANSQHRKDIWVYCDESPLYVTSTLGKLLAETRKFRVYFTIACQHLSQFSGSGLERLKDSVLNNTAVKVIGSSAQKDLIALSKEASFDASISRHQLRPGSFVLSAGSRPTILYTAPSHLVLPQKHQVTGNKFHLSEGEFEAVLADQIARFCCTSSQASTGHSTQSKQHRSTTSQSPPKVDPL